MPSSLGSLVVSLGLDAAQFVDGLTKSEYQARNFVRSVTATTTRIAGTFAVIAGAAAAPIAALRAMTGEMDNVSKAAQRASMPTEAFSALAYAGDLADVSMESLVSSMGRLARAQSDALRSATSQQAEAFQQLGIEISNTDGTLRTSSEVFADFADRFEKFGGTPEVVASGMAIFGRSFQEMIPLLSGGSRGLQEAAEEAAAFGVVMSTEAGKQAEAFNDNLSRLSLGLLGMKRTIVAEMLPAAITLTDQFVALAKEVTGADGVVRRLADDGTLKDWAQKGAIAIATIAESLVFLGKAAHTVSGSFSAVFADIQVANAASRNMFGGFLFEENRKALSDALEARNKTVADANARLDDLINYDGARLSRSLRETFALGDFVGPPKPGKTKPRLEFSGPSDGGKTSKAAMDAELAAVKRFLQGLTSAYDSAESILEAQRSAGLAGEAEYYDAKRAFIQLNADAEVRALQAQNARIAAEKASGADRIKALQQIADNEAEIERIRTNTAAGKEVLDIKQTAANNAIVRSFEEARQAAQAYLDTLVQAQQRELDGMGMGQRFRDRQAGGQQIDDRYQAQRDELANNRALLELEGKWTEESQAQYDKRLQIINEFHAKARESYDAFWVYRQRREADGLLGAQEAVRNYLSEAENAYAQSAEAMGSMLKTLEDGFAGVMDGNYKSFRDFADAMEHDFISTINRMVAKALTAQLAKALGLDQMGSGGSGGGGFAGFLAGLLGGGGGIGYGTAGTAAATAMVPTLGGGYVPALAGGGPVEAGGLYRVNERRTEMLSVNGQDYLMAGAAGRVRPNPQFAAAMRGGDTHIHLHGVTDFESFRRSETQLALGANVALSRGRRGG